MISSEKWLIVMNNKSDGASRIPKNTNHRFLQALISPFLNCRASPGRTNAVIAVLI